MALEMRRLMRLCMTESELRPTRDSPARSSRTTDSWLARRCFAGSTASALVFMKGSQMTVGLATGSATNPISNLWVATHLATSDRLLTSTEIMAFGRRSLNVRKAAGNSP